MPIPFHDVEDADQPGAAAFLKIESAARDATYLGALFLIDARGQPLEFTYNLVETPHTFLWRPTDLKRYAERELTASLLSICATTPLLLLYLAEEVGHDLFTRDIAVAVPVGRIDRGASGAPSAPRAVEGPAAVPIDVFWHPAPPAAESTERAVFDRLAALGLLLEPFARAAEGLREVYGAMLEDSEPRRPTPPPAFTPRITP